MFKSFFVDWFELKKSVVFYNRKLKMEAVTLESLSKEELIHYQELFSIFDKEDTGCIPTSQFPIFIRGLGHCPTES